MIHLGGRLSAQMQLKKREKLIALGEIAKRMMQKQSWKEGEELGKASRKSGEELPLQSGIPGRDASCTSGRGNENEAQGLLSFPLLRGLEAAAGLRRV